MTLQLLVQSILESELGGASPKKLYTGTLNA